MLTSNNNKRKLETGAELILQPHQLQCVQEVDRNPHINRIFVHDKGSGKTILQLELAKRFLFGGGMLKRTEQGDVQVRKIVHLIVPNPVLSQVEQTIGAYYPLLQRQMQVQQLSSHNDLRWFFMYSYDTFSKSGVRTIPSFHITKCVNYTMLLFDEAQLLNQGKSERGQQARELAAHKHTRTYLCSGAPFTNHESDFDNLGCILLKSAKLQSIKIHDLQPEQINVYKIPDTATNTDYPTVSYHVESLRMNHEQYQQYRQEEKLTYRPVKTSLSLNKHQQSFFMNLRQLTNSLASSGDTCQISIKVQWIIEYLAQLQQIKPRARVAIFSSFLDAGLYLLSAALDAKHQRYQMLTGDQHQTVDDRRVIMQRYNSGLIPLLLICEVGSLGMDLKGTYALICFDLPWSDALLQQRYYRARRWRSHAGLDFNEVKLYALLVDKPAELDADDTVPDSIDRYMWNTCCKKQANLQHYEQQLLQHSLNKNNNTNKLLNDNVNTPTTNTSVM